MSDRGSCWMRVGLGLSSQSYNHLARASEEGIVATEEGVVFDLIFHKRSFKRQDLRIGHYRR